MFSRSLGLLFLVLVAAVAGAWLAGLVGALVGALLVMLAVIAADLWRAQKVDNWLRHNNVQDPPILSGLWGDLVDRLRRIVTEQRKQTQTHEQRLQDFLSAIQASPNGVVLLDPQGRIEWCNQTAAQHLGLDAKRDLLQHVVHLLRDPIFTKYFAQAEHDNEVLIDGRSDSLQKPFKLSLQLHAYGENRQLLLTRDVTAVEQADAMRRDFVANVSHEIRTPLTVLSGFVETLQTLHLSDSERSTYLNLMANQAQRMENLVNDLLMLSKLEGSPLPAITQSVSIQALTNALQQEAQALLSMNLIDSQASQKLHFQAVPEMDLLGSQTELQSAASNLVSNAIRYTPGGGSIDVRWDALPDGRLQFSVADTGPGIAPEHLPRLSERFYRVDRSRSRDSGGTGLGLAITKHVMQRHGGELKIESKLGQGSRFSLIFPGARVGIQKIHQS